jgi:hypothetical protein
MYFLHKNEYRIFKPVEVKKGNKGRKEKNGGAEPICIIIHIYIKMS